MGRGAGKPAGLFFVETFRQLEPLDRIVAARMQRTDRARKFTDLQEELGRKDLHLVARHFALGDLVPERMTPEGAPLPDHREQIADKSLTRPSHRSKPHQPKLPGTPTLAA